MNTAIAAPPAAFHTLQRPVPSASIFTVTGRDAVAIRAGTWIGDLHLEQDLPIVLSAPVAGTDYAVRIADGQAVAEACIDGVAADAIGGFHFAPGGNAEARAGGDVTPAINPLSCWDAGFRPACPDPRGMALVEKDNHRFWCDIYLLGTAHATEGTSRFGQTIADGRSLSKLDYATAKALIESHGKQLLGAEEFFAAAYGVTERSAAGKDPETAGLDAPRTSRFGIMHATGNMWVWGTDGDPDDPRPSLFGGSWIYGSLAGSRLADLDFWPGYSSGGISARGRGDHLEA